MLFQTLTQTEGIIRIPNKQLSKFCHDFSTKSDFMVKKTDILHFRNFNLHFTEK